jgi:energy-coupling factor transporter ATP-binding protein EcfA2
MVTSNLDEIKAFVRDYRLDLHNPALAHQVMALDPEHPRPTDARQLFSIQQQLRPYREWHEHYPYTVVPPGIVDNGTILLARQVANNLPITLTEEELLRHLGIYGGTGAGKTTLLRVLINQVVRQGKHVVLLDPKDDATSLAVRDERFLLLSPRARFNPLTLPSFLTREEFIGLFTDTFCRSFYAAERTKALVNGVLTKLYAEHEHPSLEDAHRAIKEQYSPKGTFVARDVIQGAANRFDGLSRAFPGMYRTHRSISWEELFTHSLHMPTLLLDNETTFLYSLLVTMLYLYKRKTGKRGNLTHVLVNDEGNKFFSAAQQNIEQAPTTIHLQGLIREFGIALVLTSVDYSSLHRILKSNTYTSICFNVNGEEETKALASHLGLREQEAAYFATELKKGQCLIRFGDTWRHPMLAHFPRLQIEKHVTARELSAAEQRLNRYAPPDQPTIITEAPAQTKCDQENRAPATPEEPAPQSHAIAATSETCRPGGKRSPAAQKTLAREDKPVAQQTGKAAETAPTADRERPPVKLTVHEERLLRTCTEKLWVATHAYKAAGLARQPGQNAKSKLVKLGLMKTESILIRAGRGGNALALEATTAGYELLGRTRPSATRGGDSLQHRWLIQELAAALANAEIEVSLGGKSVDLLLKYDPAMHKRLIFHIDKKDLLPGALLAIEVETSAPSRTAVNNITKNSKVGVTHTVVAVMPKHLAATTTSLKNRVPSALRDAYSIVNVFELLEEVKR